PTVTGDRRAIGFADVEGGRLRRGLNGYRGARQEQQWSYGPCRPRGVCALHLDSPSLDALGCVGDDVPVSLRNDPAMPHGDRTSIQFDEITAFTDKSLTRRRGQLRVVAGEGAAAEAVFQPFDEVVAREVGVHVHQRL